MSLVPPAVTKVYQVAVSRVPHKNTTRPGLDKTLRVNIIISPETYLTKQFSGIKTYFLEDTERDLNVEAKGNISITAGLT